MGLLISAYFVTACSGEERVKRLLEMCLLSQGSERMVVMASELC